MAARAPGSIVYGTSGTIEVCGRATILDRTQDLDCIIHDGSSRNRAVALRDGHAEPRACPPMARRNSESAIAAEALMNNAS